MQSLVIFALGLSVGSFLNVLIHRIPSRSNLFSDSRFDLKKRFDLESRTVACGELRDKSLKRSSLGSIIWGRSKCPNCRHTLSWRDLFPVLSFLFLKGKCRYCLKKISFRYPLVELLTAVQFTVFSLQFSVAEGWLNFILWLIVISLLTVLFFIDLEHFIIPDKILIALAAVSLFPLIQEDSLDNILAGFFAGLFFFVIYLATKGKAIGLGDVKLIFVLGLLFGFPGILVVIYGSLIAGTLWGLALILFFGAKLKTKIPFGTVLSAVAILYIIFGKFFTPYLTPYIFRLYV